jgi:hypothetical protein
MMLKNIDLQDDFTKLPQKKFVRDLPALNKVVKGCFGKVLNKSYSSDIEEFKTAFLSTQLSFTPKFHAIFTHFSKFCQKENHGPVCNRLESQLFMTLWSFGNVMKFHTNTNNFVKG